MDDKDKLEKILIAVARIEEQLKSKADADSVARIEEQLKHVIDTDAARTEEIAKVSCRLSKLEECANTFVGGKTVMVWLVSIGIAIIAAFREK